MSSINKGYKLPLQKAVCQLVPVKLNANQLSATFQRVATTRQAPLATIKINLFDAI